MKLVVPKPSVPTEWMDEAACKGKTNLFFPVESGNVMGRAKAICETCPVERACDAYANAAGVEGFWAGRMRKGPA